MSRFLALPRCLTLVCFLLAAAGPARADVVRFDITSRAPIGTSGYEKIVGIAHFAVKGMALLGSAREAGCAEAWVGTERSNAAAIALYQAVGGEREGDEEFLAFWFPIDP